MNLYSYQYLTQNFNSANFAMLVAGIIFGVAIVFFGLMYLRDRTNLKYRDPFILFVFFAIMVVAIQVSNISDQYSHNAQNGQTATMLKNISKKEKVPLKDMYSNSTNLVNGMTIKAGSKYYQASFNSDFSGYSLTPTSLVYNQPNYVTHNSFSISNILNNQYFIIGLKLLIGFIMLVLQINLSGKGNLMPSNAIDQLQNYVLGGIIGGMIYNSAITILQFFVVLLIWSIIIFGSKILIQQSPFFKRILTGNPQTIIQNGKINVARALKSGLDAEDLSFKLRAQNIVSFKDVKSAVLEQNGQLTITGFGNESMSYPIITDGSINESVLERLGKDDDWVKEQLERNHTDLDSVYLGQFINHKLVLVPYPKHPKSLTSTFNDFRNNYKNHHIHFNNKDKQ